MGKSEIYVIKRDGNKELLNYEKINKVLVWATNGIAGVSASEIAMNSKIQFYDGITTNEIHKVLIKSASELITEETPNYQYVAGKLVNYLFRKEIFNTYNNFPRLYDIIKSNIKKEVYDSNILKWYTKKEIEKIESYIKHERDEEFTYAGIQQLIDKYLLRDRKTKKYYETPQFMYMVIAMVVYSDIEDKKDRIKLVKELYDSLSTHEISLPTPILAGLRTTNKQYSSCVLIDVDDDLESIGASNHAVLRYISNRAGIGLNMRIRGINASVNRGEKIHTGIIPFLKLYEAAVKSCSQGGIRGGAATVHYPFFHYEIESIVSLKNNQGNDLNRVRRLDHSIQLCRLFYKRFLKKANITLFQPHEVPDLVEAFGKDNDLFEELYEKYENDNSLTKKIISAKDLMQFIAAERIETGRIYIQNLDNANDHSSFLDKITMSNLCLSPDTKLKIRVDYSKVFEESGYFENFKLKNDGYYYGELPIEIVDSLFSLFYIDSTTVENNKFFILNSHSKIEVLSKNLETNKMEYKLVMKSALTNPSAELLEITDEKTGETIKCTEDHMIFTKNRGYVKAIELKYDDVLDLN